VRQHGADPPCADWTLRAFQRLDGGMDISEQARPRKDETGPERPDRYDSPPHGQAAKGEVL
jgi:hypothetical protein